MKSTKTLITVLIIGLFFNSPEIFAYKINPGISLGIGLNSYAAINEDKRPWYAYWSFGFPQINYYDDWTVLDRYMDETSTLPGIYRGKISGDLFGVYWPIASDQKTLIGYIMSGFGDWLVTDQSQTIYLYGPVIMFDDIIEINIHLYSFSTMKFFGQSAGDSIFIRGDIGLSDYTVSYSYQGTDSDYTSNPGYGYKLGVGYGSQLTSNGYLLLSFNQTSLYIDDDYFSYSEISLGIFWK